MQPRAGSRRFGEFELDLDRATLTRRGRAVRIQPQPLKVLTILVDRHGDIVSRDALRARVWDGATFVEFDQGLNYCIRQIRIALRDDAARPQYVETVKRQGYRFIAAVEPVEAPTQAPPLAPSSTAQAAAAGQSPVSLTPGGSAVVATEPGDPPSAATVRQDDTPAGRSWSPVAVYGALAVALAVVAIAVLRREAVPRGVSYTQVTDFGEAAFEPAISPDGRTIAFMVGSDESFPRSGEIFTKRLPDGEPVQRTHDGFRKYGVAFSADGSRITYTVADPVHGWTTAVLATAGGEPQTLLANAAGLTWLEDDRVLFAEIKSGLHMGLVTATPTRASARDVYLPEHERGMAHYGFASPDRRWVLVVEMGPTGAWQPCRVVPFDGGSRGRQVGPAGACTSAAWSRDGDWMYFTAVVNGTSHVWRQAFPDGNPEQLTSGPTEEDGIAVSRDGRSILTSLGMSQSGIWIRRGSSDRQIAASGYGAVPTYSRDGRRLYYLWHRADRESAERDLWVTDLESGKTEPILQHVSIAGYDVSDDGEHVVFVVRPPAGASQIWLASRANLAAPRMLTSSGEDSPFFGPDRDVVYRASDGSRNYLYSMALDGSRRAKVLPDPILSLKGLSPDRRWAVVAKSVNDVPTTAVVAIALHGSASQRLCSAEGMARWSPDGTHLYIEPFLEGGPDAGAALVLPVPPGRALPELPPSGIRSAIDGASLPGATVVNLSDIDPSHDGANVAPGPDGTIAYARTIRHRNLFDVHLP